MSNSVMKSISSQLAIRVCNGECTVLPSKTRPKINTPFEGFLYCTQEEPCILLRLNHSGLFDVIDKKEVDVWNKDYIWNGKIIGKFICDKIELLFNTNGNPTNYMTEILPGILQRTALSYKEFQLYVNGRASKNNIYGWHISDLKIYDKPKELSEFLRPCNKNANCSYCIYAGFFGGSCNGRLTRPPQSWYYIE